MPTTKTLSGSTSTGDHREALADVALRLGDVGTGRTNAMVGVLTETVAIAAFTDGGAAVGTFQLLGSVPAGAILLTTRLGPVVGFAGDTSAAITIGDGSDPDRYHTGTPSVFATAAVGVECGIVSGTKLITTANRPTLTVTTNADFTAAVTNASGVVTVSIYYIQT